MLNHLKPTLKLLRNQVFRCTAACPLGAQSHRCCGQDQVVQTAMKLQFSNAAQLDASGKLRFVHSLNSSARSIGLEGRRSSQSLPNAPVPNEIDKESYRRNTMFRPALRLRKRVVCSLHGQMNR